MANAAELGMEGFDRVLDKYHDRVYDKVGSSKRDGKQQQQPSRRSQDDDGSGYDYDEGPRRRHDTENNRPQYNRNQLEYDYSGNNFQQSAAAGAAGAYLGNQRSRDDPSGRSENDPRSSGRNNGRDRESRASRSKKRNKSRGRRNNSGSGSRSRSRSGVRAILHEQFDLKSDKGIGAGVAGALAGAFAGHELGDGDNLLISLAGAVIGGLGANALEKKYKDSKEKDGDKKVRQGGRHEEKGRREGRSGRDRYEERDGRDDGGGDRRRHRSR
ncbi:hypothetical protein LTR16_000829 [Cryomyces antarcticus]|uniref:Glycine zipper 2TM domain-containing protein n=1 Tax=Cryomyces antarcticus TaxID=329879 RepID=A0ABR0LZY5_9PEZI|nr:hypothetical protein LTR16_000829 [Cryomyces antarcticus]